MEDEASRRIAEAGDNGDTELDLSSLNLKELPAALFALTDLQTLRIDFNRLTRLPDALSRLTQLRTLAAEGNHLTALPDAMRPTELLMLDLDNNALTSVPSWLRSCSKLETLWLRNNPVREFPSWLSELRCLASIDVGGMDLAELPDWLFELPVLQEIYAEDNRISTVPDTVVRLRGLRELHLSNNRLRSVSASLSELPDLGILGLGQNLLGTVPPELGRLQIGALDVDDNPLAPELQAAVDAGPRELTGFLQLLDAEGKYIREAKLVLVGEGAVGKSSLLAALRNEPWVPDRDTTHGIDVKPLDVADSDGGIRLNGWDFGGQPVYRPTHQLFFTAPAVYLVVWKPRDGPEQGFVDHWIGLVKNRAGADARVIVVATHGGPGQRGAYLDEPALRERHGELIVGFVHVDSHTGDGIGGLVALIGEVAGRLPHVGRYYPDSWLRLREALRERGDAYLEYAEYEREAVRQGLTVTSARSLARNATALGHWICYVGAAGLPDLVILKPDWLSTAISYVLDDRDTNDANGLLPHRRLARIWNDPHRPPQSRYPIAIQQVFLQLMGHFDISYPVVDLDEPDEPMSLVAQLVRSDRPELGAFDGYHPEREERAQICEIVERDTGAPVSPEGLMYRLIVRFHRISLGRTDHRAAVHWQNGVVLDDGYHGRALVTIDRNRVTVRVRAAYPQFLVHRLTQEIREHVTRFWKGLEVHVKVPCGQDCGGGRPGAGLFDLAALTAVREQGSPVFPCPQCHRLQDIDGLLLGTAPRGFTDEERLVRAVRDAVDPGLARVLDAVRVSGQAVDRLEVRVQAAASQAEERYQDLLQALDDEARDGPRLVSLRLLDPTVRRPGVTKQTVRLSLWCEHSRLPLSVLNGDDGPSGVYDLDVPREWLVKAAPWIRTAAIVVRALLPVSLAGLELQVSDGEWKAIREQLNLTDKTLGALTNAGAALDPEHGPAQRVATAGEARLLDGSFLRTMHGYLREQDPSFAGLERVRYHDRYLWVHPSFAGHYRPPAPRIPAG